MGPTLSAAQARRTALAAQGFGGRRLGERGGRVDRRHFRQVVDRLAAVQIDTVNVLTRAHELTFFARLGPYDRAALGRWLHHSAEVFEYWGHAACFIDVALHPSLRWKMEAAYHGAAWTHLVEVMREKPEYVDEVRAFVREHGPVVPADLRDPGPRNRGPWWDWDPPKLALEALFWCGEVAATRTRSFERVYDVPERVLPPAVVDAPTPAEDAGRRELLRRASRALGVGTLADLSTYFYQRPTRTRPIVEAMVADGELVPVRVEGWSEQAYLHPEARVPSRLRARALLTPFDSLVWDRARDERLFGFAYRIEIYVPAPKRVHGYYVLPFLLGDRLAGRVDLKADRKGRRLLVQAAWAEAGEDHDELAPELAEELRLLAGWLELDDLVVAGRGDLAPALDAFV